MTDKYRVKSCEVYYRPANNRAETKKVTLPALKDFIFNRADALVEKFCQLKGVQKQALEFKTVVSRHCLVFEYTEKDSTVSVYITVDSLYGNVNDERLKALFTFKGKELEGVYADITCRIVDTETNVVVNEYEPHIANIDCRHGKQLLNDLVGAIGSDNDVTVDDAELDSIAYTDNVVVVSFKSDSGTRVQGLLNLYRVDKDRHVPISAEEAGELVEQMKA